MYRVFDHAEPINISHFVDVSGVAFRMPEQRQHSDLSFRGSISNLYIPLSNASRVILRLPAHDSWPLWFAIPSMYGSFIRYSLPILIGAFSGLTFGHLPWVLFLINLSRIFIPIKKVTIFLRISLKLQVRTFFPIYDA